MSFNSKKSEYYKETIYPFNQVEKDLGNICNKTLSFKTIKENIKKNPEKKFYLLPMFAYPSGKLHCGHVRNYLYVDIIARYKRAKGLQVLYPFGWDSFGLPAENASKEVGVHPKSWTEANIKEMKKSLEDLAMAFDWDMELATHQVDYYQYQQKLFIEFFRKGICYKKKGLVYWDPVEQSVLAKEQVINGKGWRSGATVQMKIMEQWYFKITNYAEELLNGLESLKDWPEDIKLMQKNWIGKSSGISIKFPVKNQVNEEFKNIQVFTTKPQMIYGCSFLALSITHPFSLYLYDVDKSVEDFIKNTIPTADQSQLKNYHGVFTGFFAENPITKEEVPIYIASYVVDGFGTGAVFGCPHSNLNDFNFAKSNNLTIKKIIKSTDANVNEETIPTGEMINCCKEWNGRSSEEVQEELKEIIKEKKDPKYSSMEFVETFNLKDWLISRQRYWGCPIPIVYCSTCGVLPENLENIPITLPEDVNFLQGGNPLENHPSWKHTQCPKCNNTAIRETDTMDTFVDSSWYFFRYFSLEKNVIIDKDFAKIVLPIDLYIGGKEHAVLHLLYCRFITMALRDLGYLHLSEPVTKLVNQGLVCMATYFNLKTQKWIYPGEVIYRAIKKAEDKQLENYDEATNSLLFTKNGDPAKKGPAQKMSKSKKNLVEPKELMETYGVDNIRFTMISDNPVNKEIEVRREAFTGSSRFLNNVWYFGHKVLNYLNSQDQKKEIGLEENHYINESFIKCEQRLEKLEINLFAVSLREILSKINELIEKDYGRESVRKIWMNFLRVLAVVCPYIAQAQWALFKRSDEATNILEAGWFQIENHNFVQEEINIAVLINNKMSFTITIEKSMSEKEIKNLVLEKAKIHENQLEKIFFIKNRNMINLVIHRDK